MQSFCRRPHPGTRGMFVLVLTSFAALLAGCGEKDAARKAGLTETASERYAMTSPLPTSEMASVSPRVALDVAADREALETPPAEAPPDEVEHNTEAYGRIEDNPFLAVVAEPAVDLLDRRRHRLVRQRPPVLAGPEHAAAAGRGADRGTGQLLPLRLRTAVERRPVRRAGRGRPMPLGARASAGPDRLEGPGDRPGRAAADEPRLPARRLRLDERAEQAAAGQGGDADARRAARRERPRGDRRLRQRRGPGAALDLRRAQGGDPLGHRPARRPAARRPAARASSSPTRSRPSTSSRAGSTA